MNGVHNDFHGTSVLDMATATKSRHRAPKSLLPPEINECFPDCCYRYCAFLTGCHRHELNEYIISIWQIRCEVNYGKIGYEATAYAPSVALYRVLKHRRHLANSFHAEARIGRDVRVGRPAKQVLIQLCTSVRKGAVLPIYRYVKLSSLN